MNARSDVTLYAQRRARVASALAVDGPAVAIVPTAPEVPRNRDSDYPYRHDSYFHYLTGFSEPGSLLVIMHTGQSLLFCRPKDLEREIWDGYRLGPEAAPAVLGVDQALPSTALDEQLPHLLANQRAVWWPFATHRALETQLEAWLQAVRARIRQGVEAPTTQRDLCSLLDEMRLIKDAHEQDIMRRAARISAAAHARAMRHSAKAFKHAPYQPLREYHLEAELLHEFRRHGAQAPAYTSIVAAGANACVLHYRAADAVLKPGELCLIDAGCELDGYASDITRTFPADGKYSSAQRELYDLVLAAQEAAVQATRPGRLFNDPHDAATRLLAQGMLDLGLLDAQRHGSLDDVMEQAAYRQFYMHRTGHWLGMDVHDCGSYVVAEAQPTLQPDGMGGEVMRKPSRPLQPGMVLTIEPGIYVRPAPDVPERYWNIGIRIEDDAIVTDGGCELITRDVPAAADDIEALMRA